MGKKEDEFLYKGHQYQIPKGKDIFKIKITDDGMEVVKNDGDTEAIPAVPGKDIKTLEGVFFKPVGKKLTINFQNDTGGELYVITGKKLSFDAHKLQPGKIQTIKIKPDMKSKHRFAVAPKGSVSGTQTNREFSAEYFEVCSGGVVKLEMPGRELVARLVKPTQQTEELEHCGSKVLRDRDNFTVKDTLGFVLKGLGVGAMALVGISGLANLATGVAGMEGMGGIEGMEGMDDMDGMDDGCGMDTEQPMEPAEPVEPPMEAPVREGLVPPKMDCPT